MSIICFCRRWYVFLRRRSLGLSGSWFTRFAIYTLKLSLSPCSSKASLASDTCFILCLNASGKAFGSKKLKVWRFRSTTRELGSFAGPEREITSPPKSIIHVQVYVTIFRVLLMQWFRISYWFVCHRRIKELWFVTKLPVARSNQSNAWASHKIWRHSQWAALSAGEWCAIVGKEMLHPLKSYLTITSVVMIAVTVSIQPRLASATCSCRKQHFILRKRKHRVT